MRGDGDGCNERGQTGHHICHHCSVWTRLPLAVFELPPAIVEYLGDNAAAEAGQQGGGASPENAKGGTHAQAHAVYSRPTRMCA